ncbi:ribonuclease J [candidate division WWE3 bacterium]|nr:ribonuclease J [candidate division WWE3 bacterium]
MKISLDQINTISSDLKPPLKFIAVGDGVTKNLSIYEYGNDIIAVDYGIGFPGVDDVGVDFIIPDMTYLVENASRVKGLFISHAHADHFGAVPHLIKELNLPIYCSKLTQAYIKNMLDEKQFKNLKDGVKFHEFGANTGVVSLGAFKVSAFNVNHSVPGSLGIVIDTPEGRVVHIADFKIDATPVIDPPMDLGKLADICKNGVLCLVSDSLGARSKGSVASERTLDGTFPKLFSKYPTNQLFITIISSNISRMYQIVEAAVKAGRRVVPTGRSVDTSVKIARNLGYLPFPDSVFVDLRKASEMPQESLVYLVAGCFGQSGSALDRISRAEHRNISLEENAIVIYSAEPNPPGVDVDVENVSSNLVLLGAEVLDHTNFDNLHVSGHGHRDELLKVATIVKPKYFIPKGGTPLQMHAYKNMLAETGVDKKRIFELQEGEVIEFIDGEARRGKRLEVHDVYFDGSSVSPIVIGDRRVLSQDGVFVVVIPVNESTKEIGARADIVTRGFVYVKESGELVGGAKTLINNLILKNKVKGNDWGALKSLIEKEVEKYLHKATGRMPMVIVHGAKF